MLGGTYNGLTAGQWDAFDAISARLRSQKRTGERYAGFEYRLISKAAYPSGFAELVQALQSGDAAAVEPAILWLDSDVFCLHSGYAKERVMRYLARSVLSTRQAARVRRLLLRVVERGGRPEFRMACRLARRVETHEFRRSLATLAADEDPGVADRAGWMLAACERNDSVR
ncbi:MAG TPA: hypothetical protein VFC99_06040 [Acidimicrobiia bacterium]|nr:hypothetical protein [Acidimicrobiia bacterium]